MAGPDCMMVIKSTTGTARKECKMKRYIATLLPTLLLLTLAAPLMAFERIPSTNPGAHAARLVGQPGDPSKDIFEVRFLAVNGINIPGGGREVLWLEPGRYEITVAGTARDPMARRFTRGRSDPGSNIIEVVVEANKSYHIGMKYDRSVKRSPYSTVVHRISDN
jgi:hypothetical protein